MSFLGNGSLGLLPRGLPTMVPVSERENGSIAAALALSHSHPGFHLPSAAIHNGGRDRMMQSNLWVQQLTNLKKAEESMAKVS